MTSSTHTTTNLEQVREFLSIMDKDVQTRHLALDCGTHTVLTAGIAEYYQNPIMSMIKTGEGLDDVIKGMIVGVFDKFMLIHKELITKAYRLIDKTSLHYFVVLNEDNFDNRDTFFQFLDQYESLGIDHKLPVQVQFLTPSAIGKMKGVDELVLTAQMSFVKQASHNQNFLDSIEEKFPDVFLDWKITIMFYIAVHLLKELAQQYHVDIGRTHEETARLMDPAKSPALKIPDKVWRCYRHLYRYSKEQRYDGLIDDASKHEARELDYKAAKNALSIFCGHMEKEGIKH